MTNENKTKGRPLGRPASPYKRVQVASLFRVEEKQALDTIASALEISTGELVRRGVMYWLQSQVLEGCDQAPPS